MKPKLFIIPPLPRDYLVIKHESFLGNFRVPLSKQDFDIGAGEFSPDDKYLENGWINYRKA